MWTEQAACAGEEVAVFYIEGRMPRAIKDLREAKAKRLCASCTVQRWCLSEAMRIEIDYYRFGIWGGLTPDERRDLAAKASA